MPFCCPEAGTVLVEGMDTRNEDHLYDVRQKVGMVFQNPDNQMVAASVEEEVAFGPENLGMESDTIVARVKQALEQVRMWKRRKTAPNHLSGRTETADCDCRNSCDAPGLYCLR